jgi:dihydroorotate dehydrogenase
MLYRHLLRPVLFAAGRDPEAIHERVLGMLALASRSLTLTRAIEIAASFGWRKRQDLERTVFGLRFPTPIGLAAGFDKNAVAVPALAALGFGFVEVGTVTRHAQPGNPRPRLFRLPADEALINRMGFNNVGAATVAERLAAMPPVAVPLGVSLGKSKVTPLENAADDYLTSLDLLYPYGDYFAVNVSSPNTPGLRQLQERDYLDALLVALQARLSELAKRDGRAAPKPLLVKVAPDLDEAALDEIVAVALACNASGLIAVNTTIDRSGLSANANVSESLRSQVGGLSGRPLHARAVAVVRHLHRVAGARLPIVGCGGIFMPDDAKRMLDAGATLLQLYTGFIYEGPLIARRLAAALSGGASTTTAGSAAPSAARSPADS